jgi:UDP-2-acetamido-3-amino-2,3-dideoxy-glucuronate N-acetyltransferase
MSDVYIHPSANVSPEAVLGEGTRVWHEAQVREGAVIGRNCILGKGSYVDFGVRIGDNVKIQNYANVYHGVTLESGVFVGPHVVLTNDRLPRAINPDGSLKGGDDWELGLVLVKEGASLGAGAIIVAGVTIGRFAMVGAGAVVTHDVPDHGLAFGNPARLMGYVCACGHKMAEAGEQGSGTWRCPVCGREIEVKRDA